MSDTTTEYRPMPPDLVKAVAAIGRVIDTEKTAAIYAPFAQKPPYKNVSIARDVKYGPAALNALDVFAPDVKGRTRPVLMFVHGGGYVRGDKCEPGTPFHDNIMLWAVQERDGRCKYQLPTCARGAVARWSRRHRCGRSLGCRPHRLLWRRSTTAFSRWDIPQAEITSRAMSRIPNFTARKAQASLEQSWCLALTT